MENQSKHHCRAMVITCMDFRFRSSIRDFLISMDYKDNYDMVSLAGSTKDLAVGDEAGEKIILKQIDISCRLHEIKKLVIIHHLDCGAYGGHTAFDNLESEKAKHIEDMKKVAEIIREKHSDLEIELILARIEESGDKPVIDFEIVK